MSSKTTIYVGMVIGSTIGGLLPVLWGDSPLSLSSVMLTGVGGFLGIYLGYKMSL